MRHRLTRGTAFRLAALVVVIITLVNSVIFSALYYSLSTQLTAHLRAHIDEVRKTLIDVQGKESDGFQELAAMIESHARVAKSDEDIYLLTDSSGKRIAGNVASLERFEDWRTIPWRDLNLLGDWSPHRASDAVIGRWTTINGGYLFVGDGNGDIRDAQRLQLNGLMWGIGLSVICAIIGGWFLGSRAQRRIGQMEEALNAVASGALDRRVPRVSASDDIDHVAALINAALDRLQRLFENLRQLSVDIAHDLRTPISRMRQRLEHVRSGGDSIEAYREAADASIAEIDNIAETFDALMRISEIEAGARKNRFADVDLKPMLTNIVDALEAVAEERGHRLHPLIAAEGSFIVHADHRLLNQLFLNLIENAIVHCQEPADISVEVTNVGGCPVVRIRDTGPGIPAEERENVFRRLYRLEKSRTTAGNGLGLSLVAAIADLHGARITLADNEPGLLVEIWFSSSV
ncbi:HAMP domain-containing sensor histidine kinase [Hyphomicrobium sp. 802]|uniref:sensor histidine kinase n=1 Tax=Hyphomicrobium sp. 802 TaxID=1112272 RepID=UPI00045E6426|nr:HAMP domain-containing sensor histidine kinase [Hyphomicrobium sp. 802]